MTVGPRIGNLVAADATQGDASPGVRTLSFPPLPFFTVSHTPKSARVFRQGSIVTDGGSCCPVELKNGQEVP